MLYALKRGNSKIITKHMQGMAVTEVPCKSIVKSVLGQPNIMSMIPFKPLHSVEEAVFLQGGHLNWHNKLEEDCSLTMFAENKGFSSFVFLFYI